MTTTKPATAQTLKPLEGIGEVGRIVCAGNQHWNEPEIVALDRPYLGDVDLVTNPP
jgi:hypothetical protein